MSQVTTRRRELESYEWRDGAGTIQSEIWYVVELHTHHDKRTKLEAFSGRLGTRKDAEEYLERIVNDWARGGGDRKFAIVRVFPAELVVTETKLLWTDKPGEEIPRLPICRCMDKYNCSHSKEKP